MQTVHNSQAELSAPAFQYHNERPQQHATLNFDEDDEMSGPPPAPKLKPLSSPQHNNFYDCNANLPMPAAFEMPMQSHSYGTYQASGLQNSMLEQTGSFRLAATRTQDQLQASKKLTEMLAVLTDRLSQELAASTSYSHGASSCPNCSSCQLNNAKSMDDERMMQLSQSTTPDNSQSFVNYSRQYNRSSFGPSSSRPNLIPQQFSSSQSLHSYSSYTDEAKRAFHQAPVDFLFGSVSSNADQRSSSFDMAQSC